MSNEILTLLFLILAIFVWIKENKLKFRENQIP